MLEWRKILVATDFSPTSRVALRSAVNVAAQARATIEVVHVVERLPARYKMILGAISASDVDLDRVKRAEEHLARLLGRLRAPRVALEGFVRLGKPWEEILAASREVEADLICIGNSGHSPVERLLLGSTAENIVSRASLPVLVTKKRVLQEVRRVLVPIDFEEGSRSALRYAVQALPESVQVAALHVIPAPVPDPAAINYAVDLPAVERDLRLFLEQAGAVRADSHVIPLADAAHEILRFAKEADVDLILVATHGRQGFGRFMLGSVAEKVVRHADRPVLVLRGPVAASNTGDEAAAGAQIRASS